MDQSPERLNEIQTNLPAIVKSTELDGPKTRTSGPGTSCSVQLPPLQSKIGPRGSITSGRGEKPGTAEETSHRMFSNLNKNIGFLSGDQEGAERNSDLESTAPNFKSFTEAKTPEETVKIFLKYMPKNKDLDIEELKQMANTKIKRYKDCFYFGQLMNHKRHGKGIMLYNDGRVYEGEWENDLKYGKGLEHFPNGNKYEGSFINGKPEGFGVYSWSNGEIYEGEFLNGMKHGTGQWKGTRNDQYYGEWKFGKAEGKGILVSANGDRYEGEFKNSMKHGHGTDKFANRDVYVGQYDNGKTNGYGEYTFASGASYKGGIRNGLKHGHGVLQNGPERFEGEWINDRRCGYGEYHYNAGNVYKGEFFDDLRHGYGEMTWRDGTIYKGNWVRGMQHGEGVQFNPGKPENRGFFKHNIYIGPIEEMHEEEEHSGNLPKVKPTPHLHENSPGENQVLSRGERKSQKTNRDYHALIPGNFLNSSNLSYNSPPHASKKQKVNNSMSHERRHHQPSPSDQPPFETPQGNQENQDYTIVQDKRSFHRPNYIIRTSRRLHNEQSQQHQQNLKILMEIDKRNRKKESSPYAESASRNSRHIAAKDPPYVKYFLKKTEPRTGNAHEEAMRLLSQRDSDGGIQDINTDQSITAIRNSIKNPIWKPNGGNKIRNGASVIGEARQLAALFHNRGGGGGAVNKSYM